MEISSEWQTELKLGERHNQRFSSASTQASGFHIER